MYGDSDHTAVNLGYTSVLHNNNSPADLEVLRCIRCIFLAVLAPYKYAGYPQLLSTARLEAEAEQLFAESDSPALLPAACELAHATVRCSSLNAEELRREGGLQVYSGIDLKLNYL